jgi:hypothetical protein
MVSALSLSFQSSKKFWILLGSILLVSYNFGAHFFERSTMAMPLTAEEIEFKAEDTLITIVPKFRHDPFHFITVI